MTSKLLCKLQEKMFDGKNIRKIEKSLNLFYVKFI